MTIIVFLVDTSSSMSQRTYLGARPTLLDVAKDAIEKFLRLRQRDPASRGDRYMLLTFEEPPANIKAGWKEHHSVFMNELKNLTASGMTTLGSSLKHCFDLLNLNRMQTGIDTYGMGRCPFYLEPSVIIVITDGSRLSTSSGVQDELTLPMHSSPVPGSELTKEPFRWDQRLFALVLRLTGTVAPESNNGSSESGNSSSNGNVNSSSNSSHSNSANCSTHDPSPIDGMCEVTGGCSYSVSSQRSLLQCLDNVVQKIQGGVVIHFEKLPGCEPVLTEEMINSANADVTSSNGSTSVSSIAPSGTSNNPSKSKIPEGASAIDYILSDAKEKQSWISSRKLIYVVRSAQKGYSVGHWPIPESFWPDVNNPTIPPRSAHPIVKFNCTDTIPMVLENLPFDKYELEPSALTKVILARKQPNAAWQCYISNSHRSTDTVGYPFGYLKASTNMNCVNLFVLPYDYPVLLPLLDELIKTHHCKPTREWKVQFDAYLKNMPSYYCAPLKRALQRMGVPSTLVPDAMENVLHFSVMNHLKRVKNQAKSEFDKMVSSIGSYRVAPTESIRLNTPIGSKKVMEIALVGNIDHQRIAGIKPELLDHTSKIDHFTLHLRREKNGHLKAQPYRNSYDISRSELIDQIHRMRLNYLLPPSLIKYQDEDQAHSLPVSAMGNYQEYLKKMPSPLRELESAPVRQHMFGNPFKIDKKGVTMVDETDIDFVGSNGSSSPGSTGSSNSSGSNASNRTGKRANSDASANNVRAKRRPGPLPKDFKFTRGSSPVPLSPNYSSGSQGNPSPPASPLSRSPSPLSPNNNAPTGDNSTAVPMKSKPVISRISESTPTCAITTTTSSITVVPSPLASPVISSHPTTLTPPPEPMDDSTVPSISAPSPAATPVPTTATSSSSANVQENGNPSISSFLNASVNDGTNQAHQMSSSNAQHLLNGSSVSNSNATSSPPTRIYPSPPLITSGGNSNHSSVSSVSSAVNLVPPVTPPPEPMDDVSSGVAFYNTIDRSSPLSPTENGLPMSPSFAISVSAANNSQTRPSNAAMDSAKVSSLDSHPLLKSIHPTQNHLPNGKDSASTSKIINSHNATIYMASSRNLTTEQYKLRKRLFDLVKRPGKDYKELVRQMAQIEEPIRKFMLNEVIAEAKRFKRKNLATYLSQEVHQQLFDQKT